MVRLPRFGKLRLPPLRRNWRARLRAQRAWWRRRLRALAGDREVLFPEAGGGVVAVETLAAGAGSRIAILHATAGSGHKSAAVAFRPAGQRESTLRNPLMSPIPGLVSRLTKR